MKVVRYIEDINNLTKQAMAERQNTIVCMFDIKSPRISAYQIHEWIFETLKLEEEDLMMIQIDGPKRHVYIKFNDEDKMLNVIRETEGECEYKHETGEITTVKLEPAGMGLRVIRLANLPPEVSPRIITNVFMRYGEVKEIKDELWSRAYRYKIYNGIRLVHMNLKSHIPSYLTIAGQKVLITYEGQPPTCYACSLPGHAYQECPTRRTRQEQKQTPATGRWSQVVAGVQEVTKGEVQSQPMDMEVGENAQQKRDSNEIREECAGATGEMIAQTKHTRQTMNTEGMKVTTKEHGKAKTNEAIVIERSEKGNDERQEDRGEENADADEGDHNYQPEVTGMRPPPFIQEDVPAQMDQQVRDEQSSMTTSDEEMTITKQTVGNRRLKKPKLTNDPGNNRENKRSSDRQRKNQRQ